MPVRADAVVPTPEVRVSRRRAMCAFIWRLALATIASLVLSIAPAWAQTPVTFQYLYDATGQLIRVVDSTGVVVQYVYDAVGNMLEVRRSSVDPAQLTILGFTPSAGGPGTLVTIEGLGFSPQPGGNTVSFNGVPTSVVSATPSRLVTRVPVGATTGPISLLLGGNTVMSALPFTVLSLPLITSVTPKVVDATRPPASLTLTGANLAGIQLATLPAFAEPAMTFSNIQVNTGGTVATMSFNISNGARGTYVLVATNGAGRSDTLANSGNTVTLVTAQEDIDSDGDGFPDGLELLFGSDPNDASSTPAFSSRGDLSASFSVVNTGLGSSVQQTLIGRFSVLNIALPPSTTSTVTANVSVVNTSLTSSVQQALIGRFSVRNTFVTPQTLQEVVGSAVSVQNVLSSSSSISDELSLLQAPSATSSPDAPAPLTAAIGAALGASPLVEGQTVEIGLDVSGGNGAATVVFMVNGVVLFTDSVAPYLLTFTVPAGVSALTFAAVVQDDSGASTNVAPVIVAVDRDRGAVVTGRVVDGAGNPISNATVELLSQGLKAEFIESPLPLTSLPDLTGVLPARSTRVTALNMRGPGGIFGPDPLGTGLAPDYAARFTGWLTVTTPGPYTFILGADEGARLRVEGITVVDMPMPAATGFQESAGVVTLQAGFVPIEVTFYESTGSAELQFSFIPLGGERQVVSPALLVPGNDPFVTTTDAEGRFELRGVPSVLQGVGLRVTDSQNSADAPVTTLLPGGLASGAVDAGDIRVP